MSADTKSVHALVVGNASYNTKKGQRRDLITAENDARAIQKAFTKYGFDVFDYEDTSNINLTRSQFKNALDEFSDRVENERAASVIFYYAGHGISIGSVNYLIPTGLTDKKISDGFTADRDMISLETILSLLRIGDDNAERQIIIILDACRTRATTAGLINKIAAALKYKKKSDGELGFDVMPIDRPNVYVAFSTQPGQFAFDHLNEDDVHSPFATAFIDCLNSTGGDVDEILMRVRECVFRETAEVIDIHNEWPQIPWSYSSLTRPFTFSRNDKDKSQTKLMSQSGQSIDAPNANSKPEQNHAASTDQKEAFETVIAEKLSQTAERFVVVHEQHKSQLDAALKEINKRIEAIEGLTRTNSILIQQTSQFDEVAVRLEKQLVETMAAASGRLTSLEELAATFTTDLRGEFFDQIDRATKYILEEQERQQRRWVKIVVDRVAERLDQAVDGPQVADLSTSDSSEDRTSERDSSPSARTEVEVVTADTLAEKTGPKLSETAQHIVQAEPPVAQRMDQLLARKEQLIDVLVEYLTDSGWTFRNLCRLIDKPIETIMHLAESNVDYDDDVQLDPDDAIDTRSAQRILEELNDPSSLHALAELAFGQQFEVERGSDDKELSLEDNGGETPMSVDKEHPRNISEQEDRDGEDQQNEDWEDDEYFDDDEYDEEEEYRARVLFDARKREAARGATPLGHPARNHPGYVPDRYTTYISSSGPTKSDDDEF